MRNMGNGNWEFRWGECFLRVAAGILLLTALVKLAGVAAGQGIMMATDPVVGLPNRWTMITSAVVDLGAAGFFVSRKDHSRRLLACFWLGAGFCCYHLALAIIEPGALCPCLGTLYGRLGLRPETADATAKVLAAYFFLGPVVLWGVELMRKRRLTTEGAKNAKVGGTARVESGG
jgi:hypothetical protein